MLLSRSGRRTVLQQDVVLHVAHVKWVPVQWWKSWSSEGSLRLCPPSRIERENTPSAADAVSIVDRNSQESVSTALLKKFCPVTGPGHGRGPDEHLSRGATGVLVMRSAGRFSDHLRQEPLRREHYSRPYAGLAAGLRGSLKGGEVR